MGLDAPNQPLKTGKSLSLETAPGSEEVTVLWPWSSILGAGVTASDLSRDLKPSPSLRKQVA